MADKIRYAGYSSVYHVEPLQEIEVVEPVIIVENPKIIIIEQTPIVEKLKNEKYDSE
jgi:hypothetical protein